MPATACLGYSLMPATAFYLLLPGLPAAACSGLLLPVACLLLPAGRDAGRAGLLRLASLRNRHPVHARNRWGWQLLVDRLVGRLVGWLVGQLVDGTEQWGRQLLLGRLVGRLVG